MQFDDDKTRAVASAVRTVASRIREEREKRDMSIAQLAAACGLARSTMQEIESGVHSGLTIGTLLTVSWVLELQPAEIFGYINNRPIVSPSEFELIQAHRRIFSE